MHPLSPQTRPCVPHTPDKHTKRRVCTRGARTAIARMITTVYSHLINGGSHDGAGVSKAAPRSPNASSKSPREARTRPLQPISSRCPACLASYPSNHRSGVPSRRHGESLLHDSNPRHACCARCIGVDAVEFPGVRRAPASFLACIIIARRIIWPDTPARAGQESY